MKNILLILLFFPVTLIAQDINVTEEYKEYNIHNIFSIKIPSSLLLSDESAKDILENLTKDFYSFENKPLVYFYEKTFDEFDKEVSYATIRISIQFIPSNMTQSELAKATKKDLQDLDKFLSVNKPKVDNRLENYSDEPYPSRKEIINGKYCIVYKHKIIDLNKERESVIEEKYMFHGIISGNAIFVTINYKASDIKEKIEYQKVIRSIKFKK